MNEQTLGSLSAIQDFEYTPYIAESISLTGITGIDRTNPVSVYSGGIPIEFIAMGLVGLASAALLYLNRKKLKKFFR